MTALERDRSTGWLAVAVGGGSLATATSLAMFFAAGRPFGTLNDFGNALIGVGSAGLAWTLTRRDGSRHLRRTVPVAAGGAALTVVGSALVVSGRTGFLFAGLVSSAGFALIGVWLLDFNSTSASDGAVSQRLSRLGIAAGGLMAIGLAGVPGIVLRFDDMTAAPGWIWISSVSWIGTYLAYPMWAIWLGRSLVHWRAVPPDGARGFEAPTGKGL